SREKALEIRVVVELLHLGKRSPIHPMPLPQFEQCERLDRSLKMQMEFSLRQREDETGRLRGHIAILEQSGHLTIGSSGDLKSNALEIFRWPDHPMARSPDLFEFAMMPAIEDINHQPQRQPDHKPQPGNQRQP